ncbi:MAG: prephenate dehydrogenase [Firmicutes bacterium]|nr:prephenate dehydrogenase [Bacillota bacterium]
MDKSQKILVVGLGLIGGSYAQALSDQGYEVGAVTKEESDLQFALQRGMIRHGRTRPDADYVGDFDLVVFALYPHVFLQWLRDHQHLLKPGALLTDVTGVKVPVVYPAQQMLRPDVEFIAAHPMAGRESSGVVNAAKEIFTDANYIVVPTAANSQAAIERCMDFGRTLGFKRICTLSPEEHDEMIAFLSQLTHCIAISLMTCHDSPRLKDYTGDSFRDLTRIAKINETMWSELFLANKEELLRQMDIFIDRFMTLRNNLQAENVPEIEKMMRLSTANRTYFDQ